MTISDTCDSPYYTHKPFTQEPDWAVTSINLDLASLLEKAVNGADTHEL